MLGNEHRFVAPLNKMLIGTRLQMHYLQSSTLRARLDSDFEEDVIKKVASW